MTRDRARRAVLGAGALWLAGAGCISTGPVVLSSSQTVLEQQASGSFPRLEEDLARAAVAAPPVPLTRAQIEASGEPAERLAVSPEEAQSEGERLDQYLQRHCLGEGREGTLVETPEACKAKVDAAELSRLMERANRGRWQIWRTLQGQRPKVAMEEIVRAWRAVHREAVVCGARWQKADGAWEIKGC